jgi:hypothetical protein
MANQTKSSQKGFMLRMSPELHERLSASARANGQSLNAEINARLEASYNEGVLSRLNWLLQQTILLMGEHRFSISFLAEGIGEESSIHLEKVFSGMEEPTFKLLDDIANFFGSNPDWLKHGFGHPFKVELQTSYGESFVESLKRNGSAQVYFVRSKSPEGQVAVVWKREGLEFATYSTRINLSTIVGSTGENYIKDLQRSVRSLHYAHIAINGVLMEPDDFTKLVFGDRHPLLLIRDAVSSYWVSDFMDLGDTEELVISMEHWQGYSDFAQMVSNWKKSTGALA